MEENETLSCARGYLNIKESGWHAQDGSSGGRTLV